MSSCQIVQVGRASSDWWPVAEGDLGQTAAREDHALVWILNVVQRLLGGRLGPQPSAFLGGVGTLRRWGLEEGSRSLGRPLEGMLCPQPSSFFLYFQAARR